MLGLLLFFFIVFVISFAQRLCDIQLFETRWTLAHQAPLSVEFSRQEYQSRLSFSTPGDLPGAWIEPVSPALAGGFFTTIFHTLVFSTIGRIPGI